MRIAWMGPMPNNGGGATGAGRQFLLELSRQGIEVDCYFPGVETDLPEMLKNEKNLRFYIQSTGWSWNRWYSRNNFLAFVTGQMANLRCEMKLAKLLMQNHKRKPYDLVYQFSHIEMHALKKFKSHLPPIVLHPSVHAAGELHWHRKETQLSRMSEPWTTRQAVRLLLIIRSRIQKKHIQVADFIISKSQNFAVEMSKDYALEPGKIPFIVRNPIDTDKFMPNRAKIENRPDFPLTFLFVSRIAVRKGTEMIVELSHRLSDLEGRVRILIVGNHALWSDYRALLAKINNRTAEYRSEISGKEMINLYHTVDALIQPSHYEPFGNTVGEALACGLPVISSNKVGAAEGVDPLCCRVFPTGDMDALEKHVRELYQELLTPRRKEISEAARSEAMRLFTNRVIVSDLIANLESLAQAK